MSRKDLLPALKNEVHEETEPILTARAEDAPIYDLLVRGGRVIDPSQDLSADLDIAIQQGKVASIARNIAESEARQVLHVRNMIRVENTAHRIADWGLRWLYRNWVDKIFLMLQAMEAWFFADRNSLTSFYGISFRPNAHCGSEIVRSNSQRRSRLLLVDASRATKTKGPITKLNMPSISSL